MVVQASGDTPCRLAPSPSLLRAERARGFFSSPASPVPTAPRLPNAGVSTSPSPHPRRSFHLLRWLALALGVLLLAVLACEWAGWPFLRQPIERRLAQTLQREVDLGERFRLHLFGSVRVSTDALRIGPPAAGGPDLLRAEDARLELPYATVRALRRGEREGPLEVRRLEVGKLALVLLRDADGRANWQLGKRRDTPDAARRQLDLPEFDALVVRDGSVRYDDALTRMRFEGTVRTREGSGQPAQGASRDAPTAQGDGDGTPAAAGGEGLAGLRIDARGQWRDAPLTLSLQSSGLLPLAGSGADTPPVPITLRVRSDETRIDLDGSARDVLKLGGLDARFAIRGPSLAAVGAVVGATLPTTAPFEMRGRVRKDGEVWQAAVERLVAGQSRLHGDFRFDARPEVPSLSGTLAGERLALVDLAPAFGAKPPRQARAKAARTADDKVLPQHAFHLPALRAMNADLKLALDHVELDDSAVQALAPLQGHLRLQDEVLTVTDLLARTSGGELRGSLSLDARKQERPQWKADLRWAGVRLERFVKARNTRAADAKPATAKKKKTEKTETAAAPGYVGGVMGGSAKLQGVGNSIAELAGSLDGSLQAWVADGRVSHLLIELSGIDLAESLGLVLGGDEMLDVRCAVARVDLADGLAKPEVAVIDTPDTTVLVGGVASLAKEELALQLNAKPKDATLVALRGPVKLEGSFADPEVKLSKGPMALRLGAAAALAAVTPLAALLPLIDFGDPQRQVCSDALKGLQGPVPKRLQKAQDGAG